MVRLGLLARFAEAGDLATEASQSARDDVADGFRLSPMRTSPPSIPTAASSTPPSSAAIVRSFAWMSRQAASTALPISTDDRLAEVCWS